MSCSSKKVEINSFSMRQIEFIKTFGGSKNEVAKSVVNCKNGGYAILGYVQSNDYDFISKKNESFDLFIIKYSDNDQLEWVKTFGGSDNDRGEKMITTKDGGFAVIGYSESSDLDLTQNKGDKDFWVLKLNSEGNIEWQKSIGFLGKDFGTAIIETSEGGFLVTGEIDVTASIGEGNFNAKSLHAGGDFWIIKLSSLGLIEWSKYYGGTLTDTPYGIVQTQNNNFIIVGSSDSHDVDITNYKGSYDFWILKISNSGKLIWQKNFGGSEIDEAKAIVETNNKNLLIIGNSRSKDKDVNQNYGGSDLYIIKIDYDGSLLSKRNIGGINFDSGNSIHQTSDGNFLLSGSTRSTFKNIQNKGQNDSWILKIDSEANILWQKNFGGSNIDVCFDAIELKDGKIIGVGETISNDKDVLINKGFSDILIVKLK